MASQVFVNQIRNQSGFGTIFLSNSGISVSGIVSATTFSGDVTVASGSASVPSITPTGDSNTGVFFPSPDTFAVTTGGSERIRVDSSGRLAIGTTSPSVTLDVAGRANIGGVLSLVGAATNTSWGVSSYSVVEGAYSGSLAFDRVFADTYLSSNSYYDGTNWKYKLGVGSAQYRLGDPASGSTGIHRWLSAVSGTADGTITWLERMRLDGSGRLLVGTSSARDLGEGGTHQIQLEGTSPSTSSLVLTCNNSDFSSYLTLARSGGAAVGSSTIVSSGQDLGSIQFNGADGTDIQTTGARISAVVDGTPGANDMPGRLIFATTADGASSPTERLRITSAGQIAVAGAGTAAAPVITKNDDLNTGIFFPAADTIAFAEGGSEAARIDSSGRLLVGTSTARSNTFNSTTQGGTLQVEISGGGAQPQAALGLYSGGTTQFPGPVCIYGATRSTAVGGNTLVADSDRIALLSFQGNDGSEFVEAASISAFVDGTPGANDMPGRLVFSTTADGASSPTERMRISANGVITAAGKTAVNDTTRGISISDDGNTGRFAATGDGSNAGAAFYITNASATTQYIVRPNGNVLNINNSYGAISDIKLKENIVDAASQWDDLKALQVRKYNLKEGQTHTQIGLVAQEVELVSPGLVGESPDRDEDGNDLGTVTKSVNYSVLYMKAVKALQEAMERIEVLEQRLTDAGIA
jgi:hypothetical protein